MKILLTALLLISLSEAMAFIPEASGGAKIGSTLVVAGDEEPAAMWLGSDISSLKKTPVLKAKWDDMEGLATFNDGQFFGITSHSLTKKGKRKPEREQLFLFKLSGVKLEAQKTFGLRDQILDYFSINLSDKVVMKEVLSGTPEGGGLNIEGLAFLNGKLFLGLRSPVTNNGEAIILVVNSPGKNPVISDHKLVNLKGSGIRSLETDGDKLVVLSGSTDDTDVDFGLYYFSPSMRDARALSVNGFKNLLRPESVIKENEKSFIFLQDFEEVQSQDVLVRLHR